MAVVSGQRRTEGIASSQRVIDISKLILLLEPDYAPLTTILGSLDGRKRKCSDPEFSWHEDELEARFDAVNNGGGYNSSATSIVVDNGDLFAAQDLVEVPRTGEILYVSSVSTNTLTVVRSFGAAAAAAVNDDEPLLIIGTAAKEGDTSLSARTYNPTKVTNYTQIFKNSVEASGTLLSSSNESSPHDWNHQTKKVGIEHRKDIEYAFLTGSAGEETVSSNTVRTTGGVLEFATANNQGMGGTMTEAEFQQFCRNGFRYGGKTKTFFVSPLVLDVINNYSISKLQTTVGQTQYGVKVTQIVSAQGNVTLVKHNLLEGATYGGYGILVDFSDESVAYRFLNGDGPGASRDTSLLQNRQENDRDGRKDEYLSEVGLQFGLPDRHAVATGITG